MTRKKSLVSIRGWKGYEEWSQHNDVDYFVVYLGEPQVIRIELEVKHGQTCIVSSAVERVLSEYYGVEAPEVWEIPGEPWAMYVGTHYVKNGKEAHEFCEQVQKSHWCTSQGYLLNTATQSDWLAANGEYF